MEELGRDVEDRSQVFTVRGVEDCTIHLQTSSNLSCQQVSVLVSWPGTAQLSLSQEPPPRRSSPPRSPGHGCRRPGALPGPSPAGPKRLRHLKNQWSRSKGYFVRTMAYVQVDGPWFGLLGFLDKKELTSPQAGPGDPEKPR